MKTWQRIKENPDLLRQYLVREKVVDSVRQFFKSKSFREVFTPVLVPTPSAESNLEVFKTELRRSKAQGLRSKEAYLIMSPEYSIKKLLAAGIGSCFEITHCFRNEEEISRLHNPEFTMLEWYRVGADYLAVMEDLEKLFVQVIRAAGFKGDLGDWGYLGEKYDISLPWPRITVAEAFEKFAGIDTETLLDEKRLEKVFAKKGYTPSFAKASEGEWEQMFYQIFFNEIETEFQKSHRPWIVYDYPVSQASLSRKKKDDPRFAERFEAFLAGVELGNCFSELIDPIEQEKRFLGDLRERRNLGKTNYPIDHDLIEALKSGLPEVSGIAVGVDRLIMLAADVPTVADTMFFPAGEMFGDLIK